MPCTPHVPTAPPSYFLACPLLYKSCSIVFVTDPLSRISLYMQGSQISDTQWISMGGTSNIVANVAVNDAHGEFIGVAQVVTGTKVIESESGVEPLPRRRLRPPPPATRAPLL